MHTVDKCCLFAKYGSWNPTLNAVYATKQPTLLEFPPTFARMHPSTPCARWRSYVGASLEILAMPSGSRAGGGWGVALAHVEHVALIFRAQPQQQVHPGLRQLGPGLDLRQQRTRKHQRLADPVGFASDAQAVGVAVVDEDGEGERGQCQTEAFALVLRFAGTDDGNAAGVTSSGLWLARS